MGDPSKYTRRRKEQLADERADAVAGDLDPFGAWMAWHRNYGLTAGAWLLTLVGIAIAVGLAWRGWL